ncbi:hypothetical protein ACFUCQ_30655 [Streptomyces sp. NPDC057197]|uniref:hypothetical protein n=1 Tax=Streptomyces sp. NPDC057197 TaxID=3346045 RepID=UPI0036351EA5
MARAVALVLELLGNHGMAARACPVPLRAQSPPARTPRLLDTSTVGLAAAPAASAVPAAPGAVMGTAPGAGVTVIDPGS